MLVLWVFFCGLCFVGSLGGGGGWLVCLFGFFLFSDFTNCAGNRVAGIFVCYFKI